MAAEERKRGCSRCKRITWQTRFMGWLGGYYWRCNACGQETPG